MDQTVKVQGCFPVYEAVVVKAGTSDVMATLTAPNGAHCGVISTGSDDLTFQAGETVNVPMDWDQMGGGGQPLPAGHYEVMGGLICWDANTGGYDTADCMPADTSAAGLVLTPTTYRSVMVPFTIH